MSDVVGGDYAAARELGVSSSRLDDVPADGATPDRDAMEVSDIAGKGEWGLRIKMK
jgi:DNA-binding transcriptional regulator YdaS (Cro superfamily)